MRLMFLLLLISTNTQANESPDYADLYEKHSASVVTISVGTGLGSGILIDNLGVLTAAHVVGDSKSMTVRFKDGSVIAASLIATVEKPDIALLKLKEAHPEPSYAELADSDQTRVGDPVFVIGSPFGIAQSLSVGHLTGRLEKGKLENNDAIEFLQTDSAINQGNSGGAMFNRKGEVIGITSFIITKSGTSSGVGFAVSSNTAITALREYSIKAIEKAEELDKLVRLSLDGLALENCAANYYHDY